MLSLGEQAEKNETVILVSLDSNSVVMKDIAKHDYLAGKIRLSL